MNKQPYFHRPEDQTVVLTSPTLMPKASGFLWNRHMMIQMNCRGYAVSQFMQPEPAKYSFAPNIEAQTFIQPEHHYYTDHPGRFFYVKDQDSGEILSLPYEPVRQKPDEYEFILSNTTISWRIVHQEIEYKLRLDLCTDDVAELWELEINNLSQRTRHLDIYPCFSIGYMSWMNQSANYVPDVNAVVAHKITPYQKVEDYFKHLDFAELSYLAAETPPSSWSANQLAFEGEGGLRSPAGVAAATLGQESALYEVPVAAMQYELILDKKEGKKKVSTNILRFMFGPARSQEQIKILKDRYLSKQGFALARNDYAAYLNSVEPCLTIDSPDQELNQLVNQWLPRQMFYHGDANRLTTDPQTRNYLQDGMGMCYLAPEYSHRTFVTALSQQHSSGEMPDGVLLHQDAQLKYINQVPHADHSVWLPICLAAYLSETNDYAFLDHLLPYGDSAKESPVFEHIQRAMQWLVSNLDERNLSYIKQGDWCDPMNMVGYKGKGVSSWLTLASAWAMQEWSKILYQTPHAALAEHWQNKAAELNHAVNTYLWDEQWYARGMTDDNLAFGVKQDNEGRIYLNPQSWAMLSGASDKNKDTSMLEQIDQQLKTPYGFAMLAPAYTGMREDIGRLTQKFPGVAENGSVYNHAAVFYACALYQKQYCDKAYEVLHAMLVRDSDWQAKGQLPVFVPNYYRGAYKQHPGVAGRSSHLFNTGTVSWIYRCLVEGLFGLKGHEGSLLIQPQLPSRWPGASVVRRFKGATFHVQMQRRSDLSSNQFFLNGQPLPEGKISNIQADTEYQVQVLIAKGNDNND